MCIEFLHSYLFGRGVCEKCMEATGTCMELVHFGSFFYFNHQLNKDILSSVTIMQLQFPMV